MTAVPDEVPAILAAANRADGPMIYPPGSVVELDPTTLAPSPFCTRAGEPEQSPPFLQLYNSIRQSGQQVPIVITFLGDGYICVYGHRRVRVAALLGRPVTALVGDLDRVGSAIAFGLENAARLELTFIEKAKFADQMRRDGADLDMIANAMALEVTTLSRSLAVVRSIDPTILGKIGRAPKVGRPRWTELAAAFDNRRDHIKLKRAAYKVVDADGFQDLESDARFEAVRTAVLGATEAPVKRLVRSRDGHAIAKVSVAADGSHVIKISRDRAVFAAALVRALPELFSAQEAAGATDARDGALQQLMAVDAPISV